MAPTDEGEAVAVMRCYLGCTSDRRYLVAMQRAGVGRCMTPDARAVPYDGESWFLDNGAFKAWRDGSPEFPEEQFLHHVAWASEQTTPPQFGVIPDLVARGEESLAFSLAWFERLFGYVWPWYLAVQDGMEVERTVARCIAAGVAGLFIGGSSAWKVATASEWARAGRDAGLLVHWGRSARRSWINLANEIGCQSCDTTQPLWVRAEFRRWIACIDRGHWVQHQPSLPLCTSEL